MILSKVRRAFLVGLLGAMIVSTVLAAGPQESRKNAQAHFGFFGPGGHRPSLFFGSRFGLFPPFLFPGSHTRFIVGDPFFWGRSGLTTFGNDFRGYSSSPYPFVFGGWGYGTTTPAPSNYSSARFAQEWSNQQPYRNDGAARITRSILLRDGMTDEQVMEKLGSPIERIQLENREVWKYSGYSLLFVGGKLKEIR